MIINLFILHKGIVSIKTINTFAAELQTNLIAKKINSSKKLIFSLVVATATIFASCQKESLVNNTNNLTGVSIPVSTLCGTATTSALLAGQTINMGNVSVVNNSENLYVTYTAEGNWELAEVHLYVGAASGIPRTKMETLSLVNSLIK